MATNVAREPEAVDVEAEPETQDYIEYLGDPDNVTGTAFLTSHTLPKGDPLWKRARVTVNKDITWVRDPMGPGIGQKGNRMLLHVDDIPAGALPVLAKTPGFKRVTE